MIRHVRIISKMTWSDTIVSNCNVTSCDVWTCLDMFGHVWTHFGKASTSLYKMSQLNYYILKRTPCILDMIGHVLTCFDTFSEYFEHLENCLVALGASYRAILDSILLSLVYRDFCSRGRLKAGLSIWRKI